MSFLVSYHIHPNDKVQIQVTFHPGPQAPCTAVKITADNEYTGRSDIDIMIHGGPLRGAEIVEKIRQTFTEQRFKQKGLGNNPWVCRQCGSTEVYVDTYLNLNTGEPSYDGDVRHAWCENCHDETRAITQSEFRKRKE